MVRSGRRSFIFRAYVSIKQFIILFFTSVFAKTPRKIEYMHKAGNVKTVKLPDTSLRNVRMLKDVPPSASHAACLPGGGG